MEKDLKKRKWDPDTCSCKVDLMRFDQDLSGNTAVFDKQGKVRDEVARPERKPGTRIRGRVSNACPGHAGFAGVIQAQRVRCPTVCGCIWEELRIGDMKEGGLFGTVMEKTCALHASEKPAEIPEMVKALARG